MRFFGNFDFFLDQGLQNALLGFTCLRVTHMLTA